MAEIVLRDARYSELPEIANVMAQAFWNDNLFGDLIHPHRAQHPDDMDLYWLRRSRVTFWNWRWKFLVAVSKDAEGKEVIAGVAQWGRLGDGGKEMDLWTLDPREYPKICCSVSFLESILNWGRKSSHTPLLLRYEYTQAAMARPSC